MDCRAVAVIVHGLCEHQGRYDYFSGLFHKAGIGTYRFDHRGHGRSEGERTYYTDFNELLDDTNVVVDLAIAENPGVPGFLIGHSIHCCPVWRQVSGQKAARHHHKRSPDQG